jgi:SAM-dependent methyltransferase
MDLQRRMLAAHFAERMLALRPESVLDIGCGTGALLATCLEAGVVCRGVEPDAARADLARVRGLDVVEADARKLAFDDEAFDWVTLRHVPHHLAEPRAVVREAWRVARSGVLIAEPWFDDSLASQRAARRADSLYKRLDRARGVFHEDVLSSGELVALFPSGARCEIAPRLPLRPWTPEDLRREWDRSCGDTAAAGPDRALFEELCALAGRGELTLHGTVLVTALKRGRAGCP